MANLSNINNKFLVTTGGNVLIGQTSAIGSSIFQVTGTVQITGSSLTVINGSDPVVTVSDTDTNYRGSMRWLSSSNVLEFFTRYAGTYYTNNLVLDRGKVGIGTNAPNSRLTVQAVGSQTTQRAITIFHNNTLAGGYASIGAQYTATNGYIDSEIRFGGETLNGACSFMSFATGCNNTITGGSNSEKMRITSDGMIGVGMTPSTAGGSTYMLQMYNAGSQCFLALGNGTSGNGPLNGVGIGNDASNAYIYNRESTTLQFGTSDSTKMVILSGGNVGIGETSPEFRLDVKSNSDTAPSAYLRGGKSSQGEIQNTGLIIGTQTTMVAGDYQGISFTGYTSSSAIRRGRAAIGVEAINGPGKMDLVFMTRYADDGTQLTSADEKMRITGNGLVGIGTTPTEMLHIKGGGNGPEIRLEGTWGSHYIRAYNDNWNFLVGGTVQAINIKNSGAVQMGTTNSAAKLNVGGPILASDNNLSAGMYVRRSLNLSHPGNTGTFTRTFNPVTQFGMAKAGGYVLLEVAGWSQRVNCGYIQFQNAGGAGNITSVVYVQTAVNGNGSISVTVNSAGDNSIDVNFSNWHGNSHAWQAKIITQ